MVGAHCAGDQPADLGRAGEAQGADARRPRTACPTIVAASPVTTLNTPAGRPARSPEFRQGQRRQRRLGRGMRDDGAAGGKRGRRLAGQHRRREIPRRDDADDAKRLAPHDHLGARPDGW